MTLEFRETKRQHGRQAECKALTISFHELTRHHGFKELREIAVYRLGGDEPEKLGTIHCSDRQFEGQYLARITIEELGEIKRKMLEV